LNFVHQVSKIFDVALQHGNVIFLGNLHPHIYSAPFSEKFMFPIQDQISVATRRNLESQLALFATLTHKTFESIEKLVSLNVTAVKVSLEESAITTKQLLSAKDPQEFFSLSAAQAQPTIEKALAYTRHLASIASGTQAEFTKAAEAQIVEANQQVSKLVEEATNNAPIGSENIATIMKSAIESATNNYEQFNRTAKQAMGTLETNLNSVTNQFATAK
jgi:phasin family protein